VELGLAGWLLGSAALAIGTGIAVGGAPRFSLCVAGTVTAAALIARRPFAALVVVLLLRAVLPNSVLIGFLVLGGGTLALLVAAPRLPAKQIVWPFLLVLLLALPGLPLSPSPDEGPAPGPLRLPLLGTAYADAPSAELLAWMNLASVLAAFCLAGWAVTTRGRLQRLITTVLVSALVPMAIAVQQLANGNTVRRSGSSLQALRGPFLYPNYFAFYLVVILVIATVVLMESRVTLVRVAVGALIAAAATCLFLTYTRGAWIGFGLALITLAVLRYRRLLVVAGVALLLAVLLAPGATHQAEQRFGDLTSRSEASQSNSWTWRVNEWTAILPYGFEHPLTGQGFASYSRVTVRRFGHSNRRYPTVQEPSLGVFSPLGFTAHNDYVKMLVEMGVPGLVLWILVFVGAIRAAARAGRIRGLGPPAVATLAVMLALMVMSISDNLQGYTVVLMYAFAVCGALCGLMAAAHAAPSPREVGAAAVGVTSPPVAAAEPEQESEPAHPEHSSTAHTETTLARGGARLRALLRRRRGTR
jgi:O-antigen ligase